MNIKTLINNGQIAKITDETEIINMSCNNPKNIAILIQYMENSITFGELLKLKYGDPYFENVELLCILLQIYLPLSALTGKFSHNDLHGENVLLYKIPNNKYIELTYVLENGVKITFKTQYIAKMIDYGRCYFNDSINDINSISLYKNIKKNIACSDDAIKKKYIWFNNQMTNNNHYISLILPNTARDLWLAVDIRERFEFKSPSYTNDGQNNIWFNIKNALEFIPYNSKNRMGPPIMDPNCKTLNGYDLCNVKKFANALVNILISKRKMFNLMQTEHLENGVDVSDVNLYCKINVYLNLNQDMEIIFTEPLNTTILNNDAFVGNMFLKNPYMSGYASSKKNLTDSNISFSNSYSETTNNPYNNTAPVTLQNSLNNSPILKPNLSSTSPSKFSNHHWYRRFFGNGMHTATATRKNVVPMQQHLLTDINLDTSIQAPTKFKKMQSFLSSTKTKIAPSSNIRGGGGNRNGYNSLRHRYRHRYIKCSRKYRMNKINRSKKLKKNSR